MIREVLTLSRVAAMQADEAAAVWTLRFADEEDPGERQLFEEWLALAPANRQAWERAQLGWNLFDSAQGDELIEEMRRHARAAAPEARNDWRRYAAAAALVVALASGSLLADRTGMIGRSPAGQGTAGPGPPPMAEAAFTYSSGRELPKSIVLPDGSTMTLDAQSRVSARFGGSSRSLRLLAGRAVFDVRHDASRPFSVTAMDVRTVDVGTRFEIGLDGRDVSVALLEGRLAVSPKGLAAVMLAPGQQLVARAGAAPVLSRSGDETVSWQRGFATFDNDTLGEAAATLNRYPGDEILVRDPRIATMRISGSFRIGDAERFARTLEQIYPVRMIRTNTHTIEMVPA